jgi:hypothetical protein
MRDYRRTMQERKEAYNPSYLGGRDLRIVIQGQGRSGVCETPISTNGWTWWCVPVIPANVAKHR